MNNKILELEKSLFKLEYMKNLDYLNKIIDDNYEEVGKSGILFNKKDVIRDLLKFEEDRKITIYNFKCRKIDENLWLVHYLTKSDNKYFYRTLIWNKENDILKIIYHQASEYNEKIILEEF